MANITVQTTVIPNYQAGGTTATIRIYATENFFNGGTQYVGGLGYFYQEVACTVAGTNVTVPAFTLASTTDSNIDTAKYIAFLYSDRGTKVTMLMGGMEFSVPPTNLSTTWQDIILYNQAPIRRMDDSYYTAHQTDLRLAELDFAQDISDLVDADIVLQNNIDGKQDTLISATNIKTLNGQSILGAGDLSVGISDAPEATDVEFPSPPNWSTNVIANGTVGDAYDVEPSVQGGVAPLAYAVLSGTLPPGLTLEAAIDGFPNISGTPTTAGFYNFTIRVTDSDGVTDDQLFRVRILAEPTDLFPTITTASLPNGEEGEAYSQTVSVTSGDAPITFAVQTGALPTGLSLNTSTGAITGTTSAEGTYNFTIRATDADGDFDDQALTIIVDPPPFDPLSLNWNYYFDAQGLGLANDASITQLTDTSGNSLHGTQATGGSRATNKTNIINSLPVARFDGSDDNYALAFPSGTAYTLSWVAKGVGMIFGDGSYFWMMPSGEQVEYFDGTNYNGHTFSPAADMDTEFNVFTIVDDGSVVKFYLNGVQVTLGGGAWPTNGTFAATKVGVNGGANYFNGDLPALAYKDAAITGTDLTDWHTYITSRYGL